MSGLEFAAQNTSGQQFMEAPLGILRKIKKISLTAFGPAAVLIVLILSVTALGIFGSEPLADRAMNFMYVLAGMLSVSLASRS
jgi:hypothetical protein